MNRLYGAQNLFNQGQQVQERQDKIGNQVGGFLFDIVNSLPWKKGNSGGQVYPTPAGPGF